MPVYTALEAAALQPQRNTAPHTPSDPRGTSQPPAAETGRPETAAEFSKRIKRVILHGPRGKRQEGGSPVDSESASHMTTGDAPETEDTSSDSANNSHRGPDPAPAVRVEDNNNPDSEAVLGCALRLADQPMPVVAPPKTVIPEKESQLLDHIAAANEGIELTAELRNRYGEDKFYQEILKNPRHHKNFTCRDGLVFIKDRQRELLCIPDVLI